MEMGIMPGKTAKDVRNHDCQFLLLIGNNNKQAVAAMEK
jgi:hypothetical protein